MIRICITWKIKEPGWNNSNRIAIDKVVSNKPLKEAIIKYINPNFLWLVVKNQFLKKKQYQIILQIKFETINGYQNKKIIF
jgi:hypothetical protein